MSCNDLVVTVLMQARDGKCDNQSVITLEIDNTFMMCLCLFRWSDTEYDKYDTNLSGDSLLVI